MLKRSNKKTLSLFVVIAVLTSFGSVKPMVDKILACFGITRSAEELWTTDPYQPSTGTKITALSLDCLHKIFQFTSVDPEEKKTNALVCKKFRKTIKQRMDPYQPPPGKTTILDLPFDCLQYEIFLFLNLKQILEYSCVCKDLRDTIEKKVLPSFQKVGLYFFAKNCLSFVSRNDGKNENIVIEFTGTSGAKNEFKKFTISMKPTEESLTAFLSPGFKKLISRLWDIPFKLGIELSERSNITHLSRGESKGSLRLYLKETNSTKHHPFKETMLEKLKKNLQELVVNGLNEFTGEGVKKLSHLKELSVYDCPNFNVKLRMNGLRKLVAWECPKFTGDGLENLTNLHILQVRDCPELDVLLVRLNLKKLSVNDCDKLFIDERLKKILEARGCFVQLS